MLRPYQLDSVAQVGAAFASGYKRVILCLPTGAGKTVIFSDIAARAAENAGVVRWCDGPGSAAGGRELRFPDAKFQESGEKRQSVDFLARPASTIFPGMSATLRVPSFSHDLLPNNRHDVLSEAPR